MTTEAHCDDADYHYDVVVIGGGAAGMMAAATAAATGARTLLLEKNTQLGKKLSITGGGRCNVTNNKPVVRELVAEYKDAGKFLFSTFTQFGVAEMITWLSERGVTVKEENEGRLFPATEKAVTICQALETELMTQHVTCQLGVTVTSVQPATTGGGLLVITKDARLNVRSCIIATGGTARPETGSTGDGFAWLEQLGHTIVPNSATLVPVALQTSWTKSLSGLTLSDVKVSLWSEHKKEKVVRGRVLFTHVGLSGPLILNLSQQIGDILQYSSATLTLDLYPDLDAAALKQQLRTRLASNKKLVNALAEELPRQLVKTLLAQLQIVGETPCHSVRKEDRSQLLTYLQAVSLPVAGVLGTDKAVASAGGIALTEVDFRTMASKRVPGLYLVGDILNVNRPSGGYSLQLCWSTGYMAGQAAAAYAQRLAPASTHQ